VEVPVKHFSLGLNAELIVTDVHRRRSFLCDDVYRVAGCHNRDRLLVTFDLQVTRSDRYVGFLGFRRREVVPFARDFFRLYLLVFPFWCGETLAIWCVAPFAVYELRLLWDTKLVVGQVTLSELHELIMSHRCSTLYFWQMITTFTVLGTESFLYLGVGFGINVFSDRLLVQFKQSSVGLYWIEAGSALARFFSFFLLKKAWCVLADLKDTICLDFPVSFPVINVVRRLWFLESFQQVLIFCRNFGPFLHSDSAVEGWNRFVSIFADLNGWNLAVITCLISWKNAGHFFEQHFVIFFNFSAAL